MGILGEDVGEGGGEENEEEGKRPKGVRSSGGEAEKPSIRPSI